MKTIQLNLLGGVEITRNGQPVTGFVSDKVRALLIYLAVTGRTHTRDTLATLFWGDVSETDAKTSLRQALSNLRKTVPDCLTITRHTVAIRPEQVGLDVRLFLEESADLYHGDFLAGFHVSDAARFDEWVLVQREQLRQHGLVVFTQLAESALARGAYDEGIALLQRLLQLDPWREALHRRLMRQLARMGRYNAALAQYEQCVTLLRTELGVQPTAETSGLAERIMALRETGERVQLPALGSLFGRIPDLDDLAQLLNNPDCRLITILGAGGMGKTRLAVEAARRNAFAFLDGVWWVSLAEGDDLARPIANALNLSLSGRGDPQSVVQSYLRDKELLLVLDNFEHLIDAATWLSDLLQHAPQIKCLVTSRVALQLRDEWLFDLAGLPYAVAADPAWRDYPAVQLFDERARRMNRHFTLEQACVTQLCQLVDGLPLALELAAAAIRTQSCADIVTAITTHLDALHSKWRDLPARHRSLRAVFDHSWALLSSQEQATLAQLSIFRGSFSHEAAAVVTNTRRQQLEQLCHQSLVKHAATDRYQLHEMVRQFAAEKLTDPTPTAQRHADYYAAFLQQQEGEIIGRNVAAGLNAIAQNLEDIRAAWQRLAETGAANQLIQGADALASYYLARGPVQDAVVAFEAAVQHVEAEPLLLRLAQFWNKQSNYAQSLPLLERLVGVEKSAETRATAHRLIGESHYTQGNLSDARTHLERSLALAQQPLTRANAHSALGICHWYSADYTAARQQFELARDIFAQIGNRLGSIRSTGNLGNVALFQDDYPTARRYYKETLQQVTGLDNRNLEAALHMNLGVVNAYQNDYATSQHNYERALRLHQRLGDVTGQANTLGNLGITAQHLGDYARSVQLFRRALTNSYANRNFHNAMLCETNLGMTWQLLGDYKAAQTAYERALELSAEIDQDDPMIFAFYSLWSHQQGDQQRAVTFAERALALCDKTMQRRTRNYAQTHLAHALVAQGDLDAARPHYVEALAERRALGQANLVLEPLMGLTEIALQQDDNATALRHAEAIFEHLKSADVGGCFEPLRIYWTCYRALRANADPRAATVRQMAQSLLHSRADRLNDKRWRERYLGLPLHREIRGLGRSRE